MNSQSESHGDLSRPNKTQVVVATTVLLSFISFWRAAAIVLSDLASSAYYVGGIAEEAIGKSAPWFILGVMLFSYAVRAVYVESCTMFTRGGVYRVVKEAMGRPLAKLSVSALMFDYILTGPISGVSAGQYLAKLISDALRHYGGDGLSTGQVNLIAVALALAITIYFWRQNLKGLHESSERALRIMQITTVMVLLVIIWCLITVVLQGASLPPLPTREHLHFSAEALGWLKDTTLPQIAPIALLVGFGHSILAMSGEESLAQVNREIEHPKITNLRRAGLVIFVYSLTFTSLVSFLAVMLIPDQVRSEYFDYLIGGLAMYVVGPTSLKLVLRGFVFVVGFLLLAGAVNTAIVGSNGVLNRVSEDGVLSDWFRVPHQKFGTTYRLINLVVILQIATIVISRGRVYTLGEAYAFGVVWSFAFKALAVLVLRFTHPGERAWRVPLNLRLSKHDLPVGLSVITLALFAIAIINLLTKEVATISGLLFTAVFFVLFTVSERRSRRSQVTRAHALDQFQLVQQETLDPSTVGVRSGCVLVVVQHGGHLYPLDHVLAQVDPDNQDVVVVTIRIMRPHSGMGPFYEAEVFSSYEQRLFTDAVAVAERQGKHVYLLVVPSTSVFHGVAQTAFRLKASEVVAGKSSGMSLTRQRQRFETAWAQIPGSAQRQITLEIVSSSEQVWSFRLGARPPQLSGDDVGFIHKLWLSVSQQPGVEEVHHRDIVVAGLHLLEHELDGPQRTEVIELIRKLGECRP